MYEDIGSRKRAYTKLKFRTDYIGMVNYYKKYDLVLRLYYMLKDESLLSKRFHDSDRENLYSGISYNSERYSVNNGWELSDVSKERDNTEELDNINLPKKYQMSLNKQLLFKFLPIIGMVITWLLFGPTTSICVFVILTIVDMIIDRKSLYKDMIKKIQMMDDDFKKNKLTLETDKAFKEGKMVEDVTLPSKYSLYDTERMLSEL